MTRTLVIIILVLSLFSFSHKPAATGWKIVYVNTYTNLNGKDITAVAAPVSGKLTEYYIDDDNYKGYNEDKKLLYVYNGATNIYYSYLPPTKTSSRMDASQQTAEKVEIRKLPVKETIAGYECSAFEIETEEGTTVYYYNPSVAVNKAGFAKHSFEEWNKCLDMSNGAVPLKIVHTLKLPGLVWTAVATEVTKVNLTQKDFEIPEDVNVMDKTINGNIKLWDSEGTRTVFGDLYGKSQELPNESGSVTFKNKNGSRYLKMNHLPGSNANTFTFFEVGYTIDADKAIKMFPSTIDDFKTENGVALGMNLVQFEIRGTSGYKRTQKGDLTELSYKKKVDGLQYTAFYVFKYAKLIKFGFGYDNP